jgi:hypothetical protein
MRTNDYGFHFGTGSLVNEIESLLPAGFQIPLINGRINIKAAPTAAASFL